MRPQILEDVVEAQIRLIPMKRACYTGIKADKLSSDIYGPPGTGKMTTLAKVIAGTTKRRIYTD